MAERITSLTVARSGGVAGMTRRREVDVTSLTGEQTKALAALAAAPPKPSQRGADRFSYAVTIAYEGGKTSEFTVAEELIPKALVDILR